MATHRQPLGERREAFYSGHVQGVGFRYAVRQLAGGYDVTGYVRNLPDGRVQLMVEGKPVEIDQFMGAIAERMSGFIQDVAVDIRLGTGEFNEFEIRH